MSIRRHTVYNFLGASLPILVSFLTVPAYLHFVGEARFGILSIVWLFLGYFGLFDLGLGVATAQRIAARQVDGRSAQARIFWTALLTNFLLGCLGGLLAWPVARLYFAHGIEVGDALRGEMIAAIPWLILAVPMATVTGVATGALQGLSRFGTLNLISVAGALVFQLAPLAVAIFWSPALTVVLPVTLVAQLVTLLLLLRACWSTLLRGQSAAFARSELQMLFRFGFWVSVSAFFSPLVTMTDRLIIGATISASAVTMYAVPFNLGQRLCILGNSAGAALYPRFASITRDSALSLARDSERALGAVMLIVIAAGIFMIGPFLTLWIGHDFASRATPTAQIILIGVWLEALSRVPLFALRGQSRPEVVAGIDAMQVLPFAIALYVLITNFGVEGVAAAYVLRSGMNYLLLAHRAGTLGGMRIVLPVSLAVLAVSLTLARALQPWSLDWFLAFSSISGTAAACAWFFSPEKARQYLLSFPLKLISPNSQKRP